MCDLKLEPLAKDKIVMIFGLISHLQLYFFLRILVVVCKVAKLPDYQIVSGKVAKLESALEDLPNLHLL